MKNIKKIKDNITEKEFRFLINFINADTSIRANRRDRLIKLFHLLYYTGLRINETTSLTNRQIKELLQEKKTKIIAHKQRLEKYIFITEKSKKVLEKLFDDIIDDDNYIFTSERGNKNRPLNPNSVIRDVNSYLKQVFQSKNITSHSFRQTIITEMAAHNINTKIIQNLIGHKSISSTYRYIRPSESDLINSLDLVR